MTSDSRKPFNIKRSDLAWVILSNLSALITAVVIGLVMPAFTGYETYAGYRVYTLYTGFASLFHLGFTDGIALRYGAVDYQDLPIKRFRTYLPALTLLQLVFQGILFGVLFAVKGSGAVSSAFFYVILNLLFTNVRHYYSTVDRFSGRFRTDSVLTLLYGVFLLAGYGLLISRGSDRFSDYLSYTTGLNAAICLLYIFLNRAITFGRAEETKEGSVVSGEGEKGSVSENGLFHDLSLNIRRGSFVMFSELTGVLILGIDSVFVQAFFDDRRFSEYSFAVYVIVAAYTLMHAVDNVIFPYLKRLDKEALPERFKVLSRSVVQSSAIMMGGLLVCRHLISRFLGNYEGSTEILMILGITLLFRAMQGLVYGNFFRALDMERIFFKNNFCVLILAAATDLAACLIFRDPRPVAIASVLVYAIWHVLSILRLRKKLGTGTDLFCVSCTILIAAAFYGAAFTKGIAGTLLYLAAAAACLIPGIVKWKKRNENS